MGKISTRKNLEQLFSNELRMQHSVLLPQKATIAAILNYSRSLEVKKVDNAIVATLVLN
jgi:hypothetical protein